MPAAAPEIRGAPCSVRNAVKFYGDKKVVDGVSFDIAAGDFLVILGPSGCGKTTTLRMIAGLEAPDGGVISIGDKVVSDSGRGVFLRPEQRDIGMVFQSYAIWPHMTVFENIAFPLRARGRKRAEIGGAVEAVLDIVGMPGLGSRPASALSGGQMQRVALARALVYNPMMLLFDEPLSNLDLKLRERLRVELKSLQRRTGLTSVYVTHDQVEAVELADRIAVMDGGRIVQIGTPLEIYRHPRTRFVAEFISSANIFSARVAGTAGPGLAQVETEAGRAVIAAHDHGVAAGDRVDVVIHPEECAIFGAAEKAEGGIPVRILERRYQGVSIRYSVDWRGTSFDIVALGTARPFAEGDEALLVIPPGNAHILPGEAARP